MTGSYDSGPDKHAGKFVCQNCGDTVTMNEPTEPWDCSYCGGEVLPVDKSNVVPTAELEQLADELLELHAEADHDAERHGIYQCKERVNELIADYGDSE